MGTVDDELRGTLEASKPGAKLQAEVKYEPETLLGELEASKFSWP